MVTKQQMIEDVKKRIAREKARIKEIEKLPIDELQEAFQDGSWQVSVFDVDFNIPYDFELIKKIQKYVTEKKWYTSDTQWITDYKMAYYVIHCFVDGSCFDITARSTEEGSTCVLKKIGTQNKEIPVYEVICKEGAEEEF